MKSLCQFVSRNAIFPSVLVALCLLIAVMSDCVPNPCLKGGICMSNRNNFSCLCDSGYVYEPTGCEDVDECQEEKACINGKCFNLPGSFRCECYPGYLFNNVSGRCNDIDECQLKVCGSYTCNNTQGTYFCDCPSGMSFNLNLSSSCIDNSRLAFGSQTVTRKSSWMIFIFMFILLYLGRR